MQKKYPLPCKSEKHTIFQTVFKNGQNLATHIPFSDQTYSKTIPSKATQGSLYKGVPPYKELPLLRGSRQNTNSNLHLVSTWLSKLNINIYNNNHFIIFMVYFWWFVKENPDYESTYVFENDFPALLQEDAPLPGIAWNNIVFITYLLLAKFSNIKERWRSAKREFYIDRVIFLTKWKSSIEVNFYSKGTC